MPTTESKFNRHVSTEIEPYINERRSLGLMNLVSSHIRSMAKYMCIEQVMVPGRKMEKQQTSWGSVKVNETFCWEMLLPVICVPYSLTEHHWKPGIYLPGNSHLWWQISFSTAMCSVKLCVTCMAMVSGTWRFHCIALGCVEPTSSLYKTSTM